MPDRTVDPRYIPTTVTVPANTPQSAPTSLDPGLGQVFLEEVQLYIPPGHGGLTGLAISLAGMHIVPYGGPNAYILGDGAGFTFDVGIEVDSGLNVVTFNADIAFAHLFYLRWKVSSIATALPAASTPGATITPISSARSLAS